METQDWRPLLDAIPAAVLVVGQGGVIRFANRCLHQLTGYRWGDLHGRPVEDLLPESMRAAHEAARAVYEDAPMIRPMGRGLAITCRRADGTTFPADVSLAPFWVGRRHFVVATVIDETERLHTEEELFHRAVHDPLTGLANRVLLLDRLGQALARSDRQAQPRAVLYVDLDGFKAVNDSWGHTAGDDVLRAIAARLAAVVRPEDTVARFGGDVFVVLCEGVSGAGEAMELAGRILAAVAGPVHHAAGKAELSASVGVVVSDGRTGAAQLIAAADTAMYEAKRGGGDAAEIVEPAATRA